MAMNEEMQPNELETRVMEQLLEGDDPVRKILNTQWRNCSIRNREYSGRGFFLDFDVPAGLPKVTEKENLEISIDKNGLDIVAYIPGVEHGIGFILFVRDGEISFLEGFTYAGEDWPGTISGFRIEKEKIQKPS